MFLDPMEGTPTVFAAERNNRVPMREIGDDEVTGNRAKTFSAVV